MLLPLFMSSVAASTTTAGAARLVVISGCGSRGVGLGIARQVLAQDAEAEVVVLARSLDRASSVKDELGPRAHALECDVTNEDSCIAVANAIESMGGTELLTLVNNAGYAADLPWFPTPWPAGAASATLAVNLFGAERLTRVLMPKLLEAADGRVVMVSSGGGRLNMKRMSEERRRLLLSASSTLSWEDIAALAATFTSEYESAALAQTEEAPLPCMSPTGLWLQSYGFSKACLAALCQILGRQHPSLLCATCSPGWVKTEMSSTYIGDAEMRTIDEGGEVPAWLSVGARGELSGGKGFYMPDKSVVSWVAD